MLENELNNKETKFLWIISQYPSPSSSGFPKFLFVFSSWTLTSLTLCLCCSQQLGNLLSMNHLHPNSWTAAPFYCLNKARMLFWCQKHREKKLNKLQIKAHESCLSESPGSCQLSVCPEALHKFSNDLETLGLAFRKTNSLWLWTSFRGDFHSNFVRRLPDNFWKNPISGRDHIAWFFFWNHTGLQSLQVSIKLDFIATTCSLCSPYSCGTSK